MLFQLRNYKLYIMLAADAAIFALSLTLAYLLRFDFHLSPHLSQLSSLWLLAVPIKILSFVFLGLYRGMWRYTDIRDFWRLFQASLFSSLVLLVLILLLYRFEGYSRTVFVIDGLLTFLLCGGLRVGIRSLYRYQDNIRAKNSFSWEVSRKRFRELQDVLVIGAGDAGEKLLRETIENPALNYHVAGFLDDNREKIGRTLHGVPVLGTVEEMERFVKRYNISQVFIAIPTASGREMRRILETCRDCGISFKTLPGLGEIMEGRVSVSDLREVSYEDLLGREQISLDTASIRQYLAGRTILVSGAGGSIGSELCRQIVAYSPAKLILLDASELNLYNMQMELEHEIGFQGYTPVLCKVQNQGLVDRVFQAHQPSVVFHAAAYKHVPLLEANPWEAVENNIIGSKVLMEAAQRHRSEKFVLVSTDKAVRPTNIMGASKRIAELMLHVYNSQSSTQFMAVRFGNVVGSSGSVIPLFKKQIRHGGPVTVTHPEMTRYFMTIHEATQLILQAGALGSGGEIFILEMGTPVRIRDMARDLIKLMGKEPDKDVEIVYTGLRPGEKITEELITDEEGIVPTQHEGIMVLKHSNGYYWETEYGKWLAERIQELKTAALELDSPGLREKLAELVPEYKPQAEPSPQAKSHSRDHSSHSRSPRTAAAEQPRALGK